MKLLLIGFDSAWSTRNDGAIVAVLRCDNGSYKTLGEPQMADFVKAQCIIEQWQKEHSPDACQIFIDQPIIVTNMTGQRAVEKIVSPPVGKRYGGVQPANRSKTQMFGNNAPIWLFLENFGGVTNPTDIPYKKVSAIETFPILAMIAMGWVLTDNHPNPRPTGRLPKYNPMRRATFAQDDWEYVCSKAAVFFSRPGMECLKDWLTQHQHKQHPRKQDQDGLDSCICLLVGMLMSESNDCLMVGDMKTGYMVIPYGELLYNELAQRCRETKRIPENWIQRFKMPSQHKP